MHTKGGRMYKRKLGYLILFGLLFLVLPFLFTVVGLFADWLFFAETGYSAVFVKTLSAKVTSGILFGTAFLLFALTNIVIANRVEFPQREMFVIEGVIHPFRTHGMERLVRPLAVLAVVIIALFAGQWGALKWEELLLFHNSMNMGISDPVLGRDTGFYLFRLPLLETVKGFSGIEIVLTAVLVAANYLLRGGIVITEARVSIDGRVRKHIGILAALFIFHVAFGFYLDTFRLLFSEYGVVFGAGYTDIHARLPFYR